MPDIKSLKDKIVKEIGEITNTKAFKEWLESESALLPKRQFVAINNSFLFRENIKTNKNPKYLAFDISSKKTFDITKAYVVEGTSFNSHFKILPFTDAIIETSLTDSIKLELKELGEVIYTIVGEIQDVNDISFDIGNAHFKKISLIPTMAREFEIVSDEIRIKDYADREKIWEEIEAFCKENELPVADNLPVLIDKAITHFQNEAFSTLALPKAYNPETKYLLDKISLVIDDHLETYKDNLSKIDTDPKAMIEILRISYNFVSDVNKLLTLLINICDLKPIILWLTISKYVAIDNKFNDLPFGPTKKKASLTEYERIIKNARNKSFHQLFPFNKSLKFQMQSLSDISVTIFSSYGKKDGNKMTFKDQELYELLANFTRVNEEIVSKKFWVKNEQVMIGVQNLIASTSEAIKATK